MNDLEMLNKDIWDIEDEDFKIPLTSGLPAVDKTLGGIRFGELTIITGKSGQGKTTLLTQLLISLAGQGEKIYMMNGEDSNKRAKRKLILQCANENILSTKDYPQLGITRQIVEPESERKIKEWLKGKFYIHNNDTLFTDDIIKSMKVSYATQGTRIFVVDNMMITESRGRKRDKLEEQKELILELNSFATKLDAHVILVAHVNKESNKGAITQYSIAGSSDITNIAHNILSVERLFQDDNRLEKFFEVSGVNFDGVVTCHKNREFGELNGKEFPMLFNPKTKKFYNTENGMCKEKPVGWEDGIEWTRDLETGEYKFKKS